MIFDLLVLKIVSKPSDLCTANENGSSTTRTFDANFLALSDPFGRERTNSGS